jgi:hypothetical protein
MAARRRMRTSAVLPLNYARNVNSPYISAYDADGRRRLGTRISAQWNSRLSGRDLLPQAPDTGKPNHPRKCLDSFKPWAW